MFASCLGVILAGIALFGIMTIVVSGLVSSASKTQPSKVEPNSLLVVELNQLIPERTNNLMVSTFDFEQRDVLGLHDLVHAIKHAKDDKNIKAIYLDLSNIMMGQVTSRTLREALKDFKTSEKPVYAYSNVYSQGAYYLASVADSIYVNPIGTVDFRGYGVTLAFFKEMLDKIGVEMQVFYAGQFKSATEPFRYNKMSDQNRTQIREYLDGMYSVFLDDISESRNISIEDLNAIANEMKVRNADDAVNNGLVDRVSYQDELLSVIKSKLGLDEDDKISSIKLNRYAESVKPARNIREKNKIAVVYAEGTINDGPTTPGEINGDRYVNLLRKIQKDKNVKAVVLRVNSGGGSVLASDRILRELQRIKDKGIPVVATMGDFAASGGYYISCFADSIFASPNTLTGSIGVFGILPSTQKMFNDKLGIYFDTVRTNTFSTAFTPVEKLSSREFQILQDGVEETYDRFLSLVAEGRGMTKDEVHEIAQGRVWTGRKALEIGLVDKLGGLDEAITSAAQLAEVESFRTVEYPEIKDPLTQLIEQLMGKSEETVKSQWIRKEFGDYYGLYEFMKYMKEAKGPQARLPFSLEVH